MAKIIVIANQKGGVGKTTTANALACGLTGRKFKTLAVDCDPQGNLSYAMQADDQQEGLYEVMKGQSAPAEAVQRTEQGDIISGSLLLAGADLEFTDTGREYLLREILEPLKKIYDYIIIDSPPTLGILTINALAAGDDVIIPMGADIFSLQGLSQLYNAVSKVRKFCNPGLKIAGLLITRYNARTILSRDLREVIEEKAVQIGAPVFHTVIRESVSIREAQTHQESIFKISPDSNPAQDYQDFIREYLEGTAHG